MNKSFLLLLVGRIVQVIIVLVSLRVTTTYLPKSEFGLVYYVTAIQGFFSLFLINPIGQYFNRYTHHWYDSGYLINRLNNQCAYIFCVAILASILLSAGMIFDLIDIEWSLVVILSGLVFSVSYNQTVIPLLNMLEKTKQFVYLNLFTSLFSLILSIAFIYLIDKKAEFWILGMAVSNLLLSIIATVYVHKSLSKSSGSFSVFFDGWLNKDGYKSVLKFSFPIAIATFFMWFISAGYRLEIENKFGLIFLAYLGVGLSVSNQVFAIFESLITQFYIPELYRKAEDNECKDKSKILEAYGHKCIPIYFSLAIFMSFSVENLFPFVVGLQYQSAYKFAIIGIWIEFFRVNSNIFALATQLEKDTKFIFLPYLFSSVFLFLSMWAFELDQMGLCIILLISNFLVAFIMKLTASKIMHIVLPYYRLVIIMCYMIPVVVYYMLIRTDPILNIANFVYSMFGGLIYLGAMYVYWRKYGNY